MSNVDMVVTAKLKDGRYMLQFSDFYGVFHSVFISESVAKTIKSNLEVDGF